jgi:anthranilate phosphoribosyltransferase
VNGNHQVPLTVEPADFGLGGARDPELPMFGPPEDGQGTGDDPVLVRASGDLVDAVIKGEPGPARDASLLGAAVILKAAGRALTLAEGVDQAVTSLESSAALSVFTKLKALH